MGADFRSNVPANGIRLPARKTASRTPATMLEKDNPGRSSGSLTIESVVIFEFWILDKKDIDPSLLEELSLKPSDIEVVAGGWILGNANDETFDGAVDNRRTNTMYPFKAFIVLL